VPRKSPIGHRQRPEWVPALVDFRRAMVRSPRKQKQPAPGEAAAKGKQQATNHANAAKQLVLQPKKLAQQMGGGTVFAPKANSNGKGGPLNGPHWTAGGGANGNAGKGMLRKA